MAKAQLIRIQIADYYKNNPVGNSSSEAFAPWWLFKTFSLSPQEANSRSADGAKDYGLDAFHLEENGRSATLHLVQAKMTDSPTEIKKGIQTFERLMKELKPVLQGKDAENGTENTVLSRLVTAIEKNVDNPKKLKLNFKILHLNEQSTEVLWNQFATAREKFESAARSLLGNFHTTIQLIGPSDINPSLSGGHVPAPEQTLTFQGVQMPTSADVKFYIGIGKLADLVRLYEEYGDQLFSKNVRAFLYRAAERGPAKHMRDTLKEICEKKKDSDVLPQTFAIFHNGVTLSTLSADLDGKEVTVREPSILNGCQTVKNAYLFRHNFLGKNGSDEKAWEAITVPIRIIVSSNEALVRNVTVCNNRQNAIRPSAFRANDPVQVQLGERFRGMKVFYERQEGAYENLKKSNATKLETEFENSTDGPLTMEELAQAIATVSNQPALSVATKMSDLFEDAQYKRIFANTKLQNLQLLVFIRNVMKVAHLALKDMKDETARLEELPTSSFRFPATRILVRHIFKHNPEMITEYGHAVIGKGVALQNLRNELKKVIKTLVLQKYFYELWFDSETKKWKSATDKDCVEKVLRQLRLQDVEVFNG